MGLKQVVHPKCFSFNIAIHVKHGQPFKKQIKNVQVLAYKKYIEKILVWRNAFDQNTSNLSYLKTTKNTQNTQKLILLHFSRFGPVLDFHPSVLFICLPSLFF